MSDYFTARSAHSHGVRATLPVLAIVFWIAAFTGTSAAETSSAAPQIAAADAPLVAAAGAEGAEDAAVETVVVSARRREENAQSVPISLNVIGDKQIETSNTYTLSQVQQVAPSLQVYSFNPRNTNINIRGLGGNVAITNDGLENGVGVYVDQVYYGRVGLAQFDLVDLDHIEVLRGPQGTLWGKNTTAGAINIATRAPSFEPEATGEVSLGDYGYYQLRGSVSGALIGDTVAGRLSIADTHRNGFIHDTTTGVNGQDYKNYTVRGQLLIDATSDLTVRLIADYGEQRQKCCINVIDGVITTYTNGAPIANNILQQAANLGYALPPINPFARQTDADGDFHANMSQWGVSAQADWDLGDAALTSVTAYRAWNWYPSNDTDLTALPVNTQGRIIDHQQQWSQELRIASEGDRKIDYVAGLYYFWQIVNGHQTVSYGSAAPIWYLGSNSAVNNVALNGFTADSYSTPETTSYAAFGQANWHITDDLTLTGGLRYTHEQKQGSYVNSWTAGLPISSLPTLGQQAAATAIRTSFGRQLSFYQHSVDDSISGLATASYQVSPDSLLYATYARGNKSGGLNLALLPVSLCATSAECAAKALVQPESVNHYEVGAKNQFFDRDVTVNLAAYWTDVSNYQTAITAPTAPYPQFIQNIPLARSRGLELDSDWAVTDRVTLSAGASYDEAVYVTYVNGPCPVELGPTASFPTCNLSGKPLAGAPKWTVSLGADASQPLEGIGAGFEAYGHADFRYQSAQYTAVSDSFYSRVGSRALTNLTAGLRTDDQHWDLSFWVRNLFDVDYFNTQQVATDGLISGLPGDPRTLGFTLRAKY